MNPLTNFLASCPTWKDVETTRVSDDLRHFMEKQFKDYSNVLDVKKEVKNLWMNIHNKKTFNIQTNIGRAKYVVNFFTGVKMHKDGSPFADVRIFKNKKDLTKFLRELKTQGYREAYPTYS